MKTKSRIACFVIYIFTICGCATVYVPNVVNTPLLSNKGELQVSANLGTSGFDPQFAYAITDNIGLMLNGSFANRTSDSTSDFHKHSFVETGVGYYTSVGENGRFETFGGLGFGKLSAELDNNLWKSYADVSTLRFFIQPTIGASSSIFDGSLSSRMVMVNLSQNSEQLT